jgi:hypothetical protein
MADKKDRTDKTNGMSSVRLIRLDDDGRCNGARVGANSFDHGRYVR